MTFATGSLVRARGREWVVLPDSTDELVMVRPLGGTDEEVTGILLALEEIEPAQFALPNPALVGDYRSGRLLRDALRLGFRSSAGPFRSFGQLAVEPRPYQLVPLLMALRQDTVRLLIADDVGIGKTIESALIAKELIAQGSARRLAVICPPHLAEQWQSELRTKFHIDAVIVGAGTAARLERALPYGRSLFEHYDHVVVSVDFIKSDRRRDDFLRTCPELVIVDEAHGATTGPERSRQQRHHLIKQLAKSEGRHLILVTATPHSGNEDAFRSLLGLLDSSLEDLPEDISGRENEAVRRRLARYLIQRRRVDIRSYLDTETHFPEREEREEHYSLSPEYKKFFVRVLEYARETIQDPEGGQHRQRVRYWSALALLRSLASSPAAAADTLRNRSAVSDADEKEVDEVGRRSVLDLTDDEAVDGLDVVPGADDEPEGDDEERRQRRRLRDLAKVADQLRGNQDEKLQKAIKLVKELVADGYRPILFCRFIPTAEYVAEELRKAMPKGVEVAAVTGTIPAADREQRVLDLAQAERHILVATDCLSEGINLQEHFDAVMHYDLSWNPTRHEQREGRVDRFGQERKVVRALTYYGVDNQIDGVVLDVLIRKSRSIRDWLGVSVPVPGDAEAVVRAIMEGLLLRADPAAGEAMIPEIEQFLRPRTEQLFGEWERAADREKRSHALFAQETLKPKEVAKELEAVRRAVGSGADVARFFTDSLSLLGAAIHRNGTVTFDLVSTPRSVRDVIGIDGTLRVRFEPPAEEHAEYLTRTSPAVANLASYVLDTSLDPLAEAIARRCGAIRTSAVSIRTTALVLRFRFDVTTKRGSTEDVQLAEDIGVIAFEGSPDEARWVEPTAAEALLDLEPTGNVPAEQAQGFVRRVVDGIEALRSEIDEEARRRAATLTEAHDRVREAARAKSATSVEPKLPVDVLGVYVYLPAGA